MAQQRDQYCWARLFETNDAKPAELAESIEDGSFIRQTSCIEQIVVPGSQKLESDNESPFYSTLLQDICTAIVVNISSIQPKPYIQRFNITV